MKPAASASSSESTAESGDRPPPLTPGLDLLADITGTPREKLDGDYAAIGRAFRAYLSDVVATAGNSVSGDADRAAAAQGRMQFWDEILKKHDPSAADTGAAAAPGGDDAEPDRPAEPAVGEGIADKLRALADEFRRRADGLAAQRRSAAAQSSASHGDNAGDDGSSST